MAQDDDTPPSNTNQSDHRRDLRALQTRVVRVPLSLHDHRSDEPSPSARFLAHLFDDDVYAYCSPQIDPKETARVRYVVDSRLWEASVEPSDKEQYVRDVDLSRGRDLLWLLSEAYAVADRDVLDRLEEAIAVLERRPTTQFQALARYVDRIEFSARRAAMLENRSVLPNAEKPTLEGLSLEHVYVVTRNALAAYDDPAFAHLDLKRLREALLMVVHDPEKKGGAGRFGAAHVAAELAVEVNAFGFGDREGDYDAKVVYARGRFQKARYKDKKPSLTE